MVQFADVEPLLSTQEFGDASCSIFCMTHRRMYVPIYSIGN